MPFKSEKQRKWMHANKPKMAKKWEKEEKSVEEDRDYKDEYKKFQSSTKAKKYRAELNKYNRQKGTYGNGDGKDASHKGGKIAGFEKESTNRGRAEKSRLKKEAIFEDMNDAQLANGIKHWASKHKGTGVGYAHVLGQLAIHMKEMGWTKSFKEVVKVAKELAKKKKVESVFAVKGKEDKDGYRHADNPDFKYHMESVNERISVSDERYFGKKGIIIMIDDNGKKVSAIFKDKKNANKFNRNKLADIKKLLQLAKKTKYPKAIDESINEGTKAFLAYRKMKEGVEDIIKGIRILRGHIDNAPYNKKFSLMTSELYKFQIDMEKKLYKFIPQMARLSKDKMLESWSTGLERYKVTLENGEAIDVKVKEGKGLEGLEELLEKEGLKFDKITKKASRPTLSSESVNEELQNSQGEQTDFKKGDLVKDINPDCPHHGSEGEVTKVGKGTITFDVTNNGRTYKEGDELEKTVDQMVKLKESVNEKTVSIGGEELMKYLMKRFKMSKSKAIATMKKHKMDMSFLKKEGFGGELKGKDKKQFEKARKENAEVLGYKLTGTKDVSVNEKMGPKQFDDYMQHVLNQFKTPGEKKMKKDIIKKLNVVQKKRGRKIFKELMRNKMKITKSQLREIIKEEIQSIKEATETAEWTKDEIALIKRTKVKVDGKMHKYSIEKDRGKKKVAKFNVKHKDNPSYGIIEKYLIKGKTSYTGFFAGYVGQGMGWKSNEVKGSKQFDEEQNLKLLAMQFKKLQTIINRVW